MPPGPSLPWRALAVALLLPVAACGDPAPEPDSADAREAEQAAIAALSLERDIEPLPRSEITVAPAGASGGTGGGAVSTATTQPATSSNASVQRVFTEFDAQQTPDGLLLTLPENVLFDFDRADLRPDARSALQKIETVLAEYAAVPVRVIGHTDAKGDDAYNQALSERRAEAVRAWLAERDADRALSAVGRGETEPVAPNETPAGRDDEAGRQRNRRVEILLEGVRGETNAPAGGAPTSTVTTSPTDSTR